MRKLQILFVLLLVLASVQVTYAQQSTSSPACAATNGAGGTANTTFNLAALEYKGGETVSVSVNGAGATYSVTNGGSPLPGGDNLAVGTPFVLTVPSTATYQLSVTVTGSDGTTQAAFACIGANNSDDGSGGNGGKTTLCHIPPGNPGNAHTITVGGGAVSAHLGHGDTLGACPENVESRHDNGNGVVSFTDEDNGKVEIYGECGAEVCVQITVVNLLILQPIQGEEVVFESETSDWFVIVFYLGQSHLDKTTAVYQINVYDGEETLRDDRVLILITAQGKISWQRRS